MDSQRTEAEVVDRLVPRKYAKGGRAMALAKRITRRKYADGGDVDYMRPDTFFPQAAKSIGQLIAPELTRYLTEPEPSYESRLRAAGAGMSPDAQLIPNRAGKVPETSDPRAVGAMGDVINLATSAVPVGAPAKVAMAAAPLAAARFARGLETVAPKLETVAPKGIRAYHGSPHDFERFDLSRIGTGEGAQAYGHGLYFAENPGTAQSYRDKLKDINNAQTVLKTKYREAILDKSDDPGERLLAGVMRDTNGDPNKAAVILDAYASRSPHDSAIQKALALAKNPPGAFEFRPGPAYNPGRMYEVNINARPEQFLDWDKPLGQQPQAIRNVYQKITGAPDPLEAEIKTRGIGAEMDALAADRDPVTNRIRNEAQWHRLARERDAAWKGWSDAQSGAKVYDALGGMSAMRSSPAWEGIAPNTNRRAAVSELLGREGIPGIKYLDQGSRFDPAALQSRVDELRNVVREHEKGIARGHEVEARQAQLPQWREDLARAEAELRQGQTSNYVVFDDKLIDILRKYGLAGMLGGGVGAATLANQDQGMQDGGSVMNSPYPQMWQPMAAGGTPWEVRAESRGMIPHSGFIPGTSGGRSDTVPMSVKKGAYVVPADIVSALGDGNSQAGASKLASKFGAPYGAPMPKIGRAPKPHFMGIQKTAKPIRQRFANGGIDGDQSPVADIIASHGEFVLSPEQLEARFGSLDLAHEAMDKFVENVRKKNAKISRKLPGPKKK
jgi:hypothetical protein